MHKYMNNSIIHFHVAPVTLFNFPIVMWYILSAYVHIFLIMIIKYKDIAIGNIITLSYYRARFKPQLSAKEAVRFILDIINSTQLSIR